MCFWMWRERRPEVPLAKFSVHSLLVCRTLPLYLSQGTTGKTYRNACRACASCCDAFRRRRYPWLHGCQSRCAGLAVPSRQVCGVLILMDYRKNCQYQCATPFGMGGSIPLEAVGLVLELSRVVGRQSPTSKLNASEVVGLYRVGLSVVDNPPTPALQHQHDPLYTIHMLYLILVTQIETALTVCKEFFVASRDRGCV